MQATKYLADRHPERRERAQHSPAAGPFNLSLHLRGAMRELTDLMGGRGAILTLHPERGGAPVPLFVDAALSKVQAEAMLAAFAATRADFQDGVAFWRDGVTLPDASLFLMPIDRVAGHGRLVIAMLLEQAEPILRANAERLYRGRQPFATGFFQLWQQNRLLEQRARSLEGVLDQTAIGLVLLDRAGHIIFANHTADELLATGDGIGRVGTGLRPVNLAEGVNLHAALAHAIGGEEAGRSAKAPLLAFRRREGPPIVAAILPAEAGTEEDEGVAAVMYLVDPRLDTARMLSPLCRLYGLSTVETDLACRLAAGETIATAAHAMHVKEQTARSYLKTIFLKTATRRQTELVALMLSSLIRMKRGVLQEALTTGAGLRATQP